MKNKPNILKNSIKKCGSLLKKPVQKIILWVKFEIMDSNWYFIGGNCFGLFPPSFYYTHTEEEIEHIKCEVIKELEEIIKQYNSDNKKEKPNKVL